MPQLVKELTFRAALRFDDVGKGPYGTRQIANITGGEVAGARLSGHPIGAGADWLLVDAEGIGHLDVRMTLKTGDGALIYVQYHGVLEVTPTIARIIGGADESTDFGDQYFFTNPRMETSDERYAWVNRTVFVGQGRILAGPAVDYVIYRLED